MATTNASMRRKRKRTREAALTEIRWVVPTPSPDGIAKQGADFWADVMRRPFELMVICRKS